MPNKYDNTSITSLKGADRVRLRPGVIFGSDGLNGCEHSFFEILSNSVDEAKAGFGDKIEVIIHKDNSYEIRDYGRGIPLDFNKLENKYNWELVYCELYAGGKYEDSNYENSLGLNGLGACATQYASEYFTVTSIRDGYEYTMNFKEGNPVGELIKKKTKLPYTGTVQRWKPDLKVFTEIDIPIDYFLDILKKQAIVNKNILFTLKDEKNDKFYEFIYPEGILGYLKEISFEEDSITPPIYFRGKGKGKDRKDLKPYDVDIEVAISFNNDVNNIEFYHNSSPLEYGGSPDRAMKQSLVASIDKEIKVLEKYNKNETKISFTDIQDSLIFISNSFSSQTSYENQTKKAINNKFIQQFMDELIRENMEIWFTENKKMSEKVINQILANKRSREQAEKQRINVKKKLMKSVDNINNKVKKFVDCRSKDTDKRELYIVEGDSALGSVKLGRDSNFQAIMPVRGKILNCLKSSLNQILKNDIIMDLIKVLGCGIEIKHPKSKDISIFDLEKLRWNKIIICTDADIDGYQIRTLILAMFYKLCPTLIDEGYIYIAETPLYEITHQNKTYFAFNESEKNEILKGKNKCKIQRSKGLGENDPQMMWDSTMNPETRRLIKVTVEDIELMDDTFELLLGKNLSGRKEYIQNYGKDYLSYLDI